jgi:hypothetical protein
MLKRRQIFRSSLDPQHNLPPKSEGANFQTSLMIRSNKDKHVNAEASVDRFSEVLSILNIIFLLKTEGANFQASLMIRSSKDKHLCRSAPVDRFPVLGYRG